jgi:hypothetical protein
VAVAALALSTATASAETLAAKCTNLQTQINAAAAKAPNHGEGVVVQLNGLCEAANLGTKTGVIIPKESNFTLEGAPGTTSGFEGKGVTEPMLRSIGVEAVGRMTISNLVFERGSTTTGAAAGLALYAARLTLSGDSFIENADQGGQGGALNVDIVPGSCATTGSLALTITGSTFRANKLVTTGNNSGGAAWVGENCAAATSYLQGDTFESNTLEVSGSGMYTGGALTVQGNGSGEAAIPLAQTGNVFDSNRLLATGGPANYGGGGEWLDGMSLTSVGDRFSRNSIPGTTGAHWSWGGGLGILNNECNVHTPTQSTLENAVVAGNSIGSGLAEDLGGAGIYIGCSPSTSLSNHLTLLDSTVTENTVPTGGVAGIDGGSEDQLVLDNSIVANDVGGSETAGFNGAGGSLTASYSDLCATGSSSAPFTGTGNICANPLLADNGNPSSFDVHETSSSPTIDAGSNALVQGLTTDYYGSARVQSSRLVTIAPPALTCILGTRFALAPAIVDMGASEYPQASVPQPAASCVPKTKISPTVFAFPASTDRASGVLGLTFKGLGAGKLAVLGTFDVSRTVVSIVKGHRTRRHKLETVVYGRASYTVSSSGTVKIQLKPTKRALATLERRKHLRVLLSITFTHTGELPTTHAQTITVRYVKPHPKRHR